jgi:glycerol-3-phosphate dehydrogenase
MNTAELTPQYRTECLKRMGSSPVDLLVIGGGINGVCVARDAALRGLTVALVEQDEFASGTSSKSSKLIHGGLRYLEFFEVALVYESLQERGLLLTLAPNLVRPVEFVFPIYRGFKHSLWKIDAGLWLYDLMSLFRKVRRHHRLAPVRVSRVAPGLKTDGLAGALVYDDATTDDACLTTLILRAAVRAGALCANQAKVVSLTKDRGAVVGATVEDRLTRNKITIEAKGVINTTGPWVDSLRRMADEKVKPMLRPTKGTHIAFPSHRVPTDRAVVLSAVRDGRLMYLMPWLTYTLLGTTDTDFSGDPGNVKVTDDDINYLLETLNFYYPKLSVQPKDVSGAFAGLRPLVSDGSSKPSEVSRRYDFVQDCPGFFTLTGGKLTTSRRMAQDTVDKVLAAVHLTAPKACSTNKERLLDDVPFDKLVGELASTPGIDSESARFLAMCYGSDARSVLALCKDDKTLKERIAPSHPHIQAQVVFGFRHEMLHTPEAFLSHFGKGGLGQADGARDRVATIMNRLK